MPSKMRGYNKTTNNRNKSDESSVNFFVTEEYCSMPNINREIEKAQGSPIR
jgi:hypothetical protein